MGDIGRAPNFAFGADIQSRAGDRNGMSVQTLRFSRGKRRHQQGCYRQGKTLHSMRPSTKTLSLRNAAITAVRSRSEEHTSELQSLMRISYAVFCLKTNKYNDKETHNHNRTTTR